MDTVKAIREWYRVYKLAEGKGENRFAYNGQAFGKVFFFHSSVVGLMRENPLGLTLFFCLVWCASK